MAEQLTRPQARRSFLGIATAAVFSIILAGCQIVPSRRPAPPPVEGPPVAPPREDQRHLVAVLVPLSGDSAATGVGQSIANAANMALLDTGGKEIRLNVYDTAKGARAAASDAIADGARLLLGPLLAENVREIAPAARQAGIPVIAFSNDVAVAGNGVYITGFVPSQSVDRVIGYARSKNLMRFAGLIPEGDYGRRSGQALMESVRRHGGRLIGMQTYGNTPQSLRSAVTKLNAQGQFDAVLIADTGRNAAIAAPLIRNGPSKQARILGTELWKTEPALTSNAALRGAWYASVPDNLFNQFRAKYNARYKVTPYRLASLGYDSVLLAVRIGRDWRVGRPFPESELRKEDGFLGIDGAFRFGRDGVAERMLEVEEIGAGRLILVSPAPKSFQP